MAVRNGKQYIDGLKDNRVVWLGNEKIDVVNNPATKNSVEGMAGYFDWQIKYADDCIVEDPETGAPMNASLLIPRNAEDLQIRHKCFERLARYSYGMLGRSPDYCNVTLAGQVGRKDVWEKGDMKFYENIKNFRREVIDGDLSLTHCILHAAIDKSIGELNGANRDLTLRVVKRDANGITVRGAKILATLGPFADEMFVYPAYPIGPGDEAYALCFSVPCGAKGLVQVSRDHYATHAGVKNAPFSSRFDEQDSFVIFDDVEIPWERVFVDGNLDVYNAIPQAVFFGNVLQQTSVRAMVKLEFAYDLCTEIARVTNSEKYPPVAQMLGEVLTFLNITRNVLYAAEARAYDWGSNCHFPHPDIKVIRAMMPQWMIRINEIIKTIGGHNLLATPELETFTNPEISQLLKTYLPGSNGISAEKRAAVMRTAWDFAGSSLGSRVELYERNYLAAQSRNLAVDHMVAQMEPEGTWGQLEGYLKELGMLPNK